MCVLRYLVNISFTFSSSFARRADHSVSPERHYRAAQGRVGLQPDDDFTVFVYVSRLVRVHRRRGGHVRREQPVVAPLLLHEFEDLPPDFQRPFGGGLEKRAVAFVRLAVEADKVGNIRAAAPCAAFKRFPFLCVVRVGHIVLLLRVLPRPFLLKCVSSVESFTPRNRISRPLSPSEARFRIAGTSAICRL